MSQVPLDCFSHILSLWKICQRFQEQFPRLLSFQNRRRGEESEREDKARLSARTHPGTSSNGRCSRENKVSLSETGK